MTPDIPALRAALAASSGHFPWTVDQNAVFDAEGALVAEPCQRSHEDEDARLIALAVNALPKLLARIEKLERVAEACRSYERVGVATDELRAALANLDGGKG